MARFRRIPLPFILALTAGLTVLMGVLLQRLLPDLRWHAPSLHAAMEALGGLCAIVMALLLFMHDDDATIPRARPLAMGFVSMGIFEQFHAISEEGNAFIFLRSMGSLVGGLGFALVWLPPPAHAVLRKPWVPWLTAAVALGGAGSLLIWPDQIPAMLRQGEFSPTAVAPTSLAAMLFLATGLRFVLDHRQDGSQETYLFACLGMLFGLAEFMFTYSLLWDARWWFWHGLRLLAYLLVLGYLVHRYQDMVAGLRRALEHTRAAEDAVRRSERQLRQAVEDRERIAQDLHDGIIQSLFAVSLTLERCQRLLAAETAGIGRQLDVAVASIKQTIRDLRGYIGGLEPPLTDAQDLAAALAFQARMLEASCDMQFHLHIDAAAADRLNAGQSHQVLYMAQEAMSNSARHARARAGTVTLELLPAGVRLTVQDNGVGFDPDSVKAGEGLRNIAARAQKLNATLRILSQDGHGTCLVIDVPEDRHG